MSARTNITLTALFLTVIVFGPLHGCSGPTTDPNQIPPPSYNGTWRLISSVHSSEQKFLNEATVVLSSDQTFTATRSMFWRKDSLATQALAGEWTYNTGDGGSPIPATGQAYLTLTVGGESKSWTITGSRYEGSMQWYTSYPSFMEYDWELVR